MTCTISITVLELTNAGHARQSKDLDVGKADRHGNTIYPVDFRHKGSLSEDELCRIMVQPLQSGVRLTAVLDSFHPFY
jgi:hypothetical protein